MSRRMQSEEKKQKKQKRKKIRGGKIRGRDKNVRVNAATIYFWDCSIILENCKIYKGVANKNTV